MIARSTLRRDDDQPEFAVMLRHGTQGCAIPKLDELADTRVAYHLISPAPIKRTRPDSTNLT